MSSENTIVFSDDKFSVVINDVLTVLLQTPHLQFTMITVTDLLLEIRSYFLKQWVLDFTKKQTKRISSPVHQW